MKHIFTILGGEWWAWGYTGTPYALGGLGPLPLWLCHWRLKPTYKSYKNWHKMTHNNGIWLSTVLFTVQFEFKHCNLLAAEIECGAVSAGATNKRFALTRPWSVPLALLVQSWEVCSSAEVWGAVEGVYRGGSLSRKISRHLLFRQGKQQWFQLTLTVQDTSLQRQSLATTWIHHRQSPTRACSNTVGNNSTHWLPHPCPTQSSLPADELVLAVLIDLLLVRCMAWKHWLRD